MPPHIFLPFCPAETHFSQQIKTNQLMPSSVSSFEIDYWLYSAKITGWTVGPASYTKCYSCVHQILKIVSFNSAGGAVQDVPDVSNFPLFVRLPADVKCRILQCTDKCKQHEWQLILCLMLTFFLIIVVTHIPRMAIF